MNNMNERLVVGGAALLVGALLGWVGHGLTGYNLNTDTITTSQDWRVACPAATAKDQNCEIVQDLLDGKSRNQIARFALMTDAGKRVMMITLPLGVSLDPGIGLVFGTDPEKAIAYRTCNSQGCIAEAPLDDKLQASLNAGKDGKVFITGLDNKRVSIPMSLKGMAGAQSLYRNSEAKRSSWFWRMW